MCLCVEFYREYTRTANAFVHKLSPLVIFPYVPAKISTKNVLPTFWASYYLLGSPGLINLCISSSVIGEILRPSSRVGHSEFEGRGPISGLRSLDDDVRARRICRLRLRVESANGRMEKRRRSRERTGQLTEHFIASLVWLSLFTILLRVQPQRHSGRRYLCFLWLYFANLPFLDRDPALIPCVPFVPPLSQQLESEGLVVGRWVGYVHQACGPASRGGRRLCQRLTVRNETK